MASGSTNVGSWVRSLWPIENHEMKKFFAMALMLGCVLFNFNILRSMKDSLLVTGVGAEAISFTKLYCVVPLAVLFTVIYAKMTNVMHQRTIFYSFCCVFIVFFMIFAFVLYPNQDIVHPSTSTIDALMHKHISLGFLTISFSHFKWFIKLYGKWSYALYYVFAELWGAMILSLLFWQFANSITKTVEAKRFYPMIGLVGNLGLIFGGTMLKYITGQDVAGEGKIKLAQETFLVSTTTWAVSITAVIIMALYYYINNVVLKDPRYVIEAGSVKKKKEKVELSLIEGFKVVFSSKYIGFIVILVFCYGFAVNLVEGPWKDSVRKVYSNTTQYAGFMANLQLLTGTFTMIAMFIGAHILRRITWFSGAIITPLVLSITGLGFFLFLLLDRPMESLMGMLAIAFDPIYLAVVFGLFQNVFSKASKYSFFDPTKEMSYIPIDVELQTKGKAAVDVVGARLAKSLGAVLQSTIFIFFPAATFISISPYLMVVFVILSAVWLVDVGLLYKEYKKVVKE